MLRWTRVVGLAIAVVLSTATLADASTLQPGTPSHPSNVRLTVTFGWSQLGEDVTSFQLWFPQGSVYNGGKYPKCSAQKLDAYGPSACPKASIVGSGTGTALADTTVTRPKITVVNGGANTVYFYTILNNPARVQEPIIGHLQRLHGNYAYKLSSTIPKNLQIVAGVPINLTSLTITTGRGDWIGLSGAPAGIKVQTGYANGATSAYSLWVQNI